MKKKKIIIIALIILGIIGIGFGSYKLFLSDSKSNQETHEKEEVQEKLEETTTIVLSINPKIALVIDKDGNVVNIYPLNEDANIFVKEDFEGIKIEKVVEKVVEVAESYLEEKPEVTISFEDEEDQEEINIKSIESLFNSKGIKTKKIKLDDKESKEIKEKIKEEKEKRKKEDKTTTTSTTSTTTKKTTTTKRTTNKITEQVTTTTTSKIKSNNSFLKTLNITNTNINFSKDVYKYETVVSYKVSSVNINATAEDNNASVTGTGKKNLIVGENNFTIKVIAEDGSAKEYNINIIRRALVNLNDNKTYTYQYETANDEYVYPNNPECMGKMPGGDYVIPEGSTYNEYCQNTPPTDYPNIEGLGYYCDIQDANNNSSNMSVNKIYVCYYIHEFVSMSDIKARVNKIIKVGNYVGFAGGFGIEPEKIKLDEEKCERFNIPCGRW